MRQMNIGDAVTYKHDLYGTVQATVVGHQNGGGYAKVHIARPNGKYAVCTVHCSVARRIPGPAKFVPVKFTRGQ